MSLDSNAALDAAFPTDPTPAPANANAALDAAFSGDTSSNGPPAPSSSQQLVNNSVAGRSLDQTHESLSALAHTVYGGYKGLYTLAMTRDPDVAAKAVNDETSQIYRAPTQAPKNLFDRKYQGADTFGQPDTSTLASKVADTITNPGAAALTKAALTVLPSQFIPVRAEGAPREFADPQSQGAAHAPPNFSNADPDIQAAISNLSPQEIEANRPVLERHAEAQSLPVKMRLTEGQATGDPDILSDEMNNRGATGLSKVLNDQGQQLKDNLQALREQVGPDVYTTNPVEHGQALIDAYKAKDAPIQADINAKYQALRDAAGGDIPIDGQAFVNNAKSALRKQLLTNDVPSSVKSDLESFGSGEPMNFEDFESMRTKLAQEMRDNPSGNARHAAGIVRQSLEDLPLQNGSEALKPLADAARNAAKARFQSLEADPAYDAAVNDKVPPDQFVNKFVTGTSGSATKGQAAIMRQNLGDNPTAVQTMGVATIDELKKAALGPSGEQNFGNTRYNNRLAGLRPKINDLLPADATEQATNLGNVARYIKQRPEGATVNESNTLSGAIAQKMGETAKSIANVKTGGLAGPVIDWAQSKLGERALKGKLETATAPLAGVKPRAPGPTLQ